MEHKESPSVDLRAWHAGAQGDVGECEALVGQCANVNMVLMGAAKCPDRTVKEVLIKYALAKGACMVFAWQFERNQVTVEGMQYSRNITMRRGPGDVARGTFHSVE